MSKLATWYADLSLRFKLILWFLLVGLVPFAGASFYAVQESSRALTDQVVNQLSGLADNRQRALETFLKSNVRQLESLTSTMAAMRDQGFRQLQAYSRQVKGKIEEYFEARRELLDRTRHNIRFTEGLQVFSEVFKKGINSTEYKQSASARDSGISVYRDQFKFADIFMIDAEGNIVYSLNKGPELGTNIKTGALRNSGLARVFAKARSENAIEDYSLFEPTKTQTLFLATPIQDEYNTFKGVVVFSLGPDGSNSFISDRTGLLSQTDPYIVGKSEGKSLLRTDRVVKKGKVGDDISGRSHVEAALAGKKEISVNVGSTGELELAVLEPLTIAGLSWALITTANLEQVLVPTLAGSKDDFLVSYAKAFGIDDIYLIDPSGNAFYTTAKEADYGTNLLTGRYNNTNLNRLVQKMLRSQRQEIVDFEPYAPSNNLPAAFLGMPLVESGKIELLVVMQINDKELNQIMKNEAGLGKTGETYLVGQDKLMRSDSRFEATSTMLKKKIESEIVKLSAVEHGTGTLQIKDDRGVDTLFAYTQVGINETLGGDFEWGLVARMDRAEALQVVTNYQRITLIMAAIVLVAVVLVAYLVARAIARPIVNMANTVRTIAANQDLTLEVPVSGKDEIGTMTTAFNHMMNVFRGSMRIVQGAAVSVGRNSAEVAKRAGANRERAKLQFERAEQSQKVIGEMAVTASQVASATREQEGAANSPKRWTAWRRPRRRRTRRWDRPWSVSRRWAPPVPRR